MTTKARLLSQLLAPGGAVADGSVQASKITGTVGLTTGGTGAQTAPAARSNLGLAIGSDVQQWHSVLDNLIVLAGTSGFLKKHGNNNWQLDTNTYLTGNQTITFSGDATGSGATTVSLTLANSGVTAGTYGSSTAVPVVVVDAKGRITSISTQNISGSLTFTGDVTGTGSTGSSTALTLANSGVTAGTYTKVTVDAKGRATSGTTLAASDIPSLDASKITSGVIDAARLPSYVDDVLEFANLAAFPATGESGKIYLALDTNKAYRWSGSAYVYITSGAVDSVAGRTGVVTLTSSDVGLGLVENKSSATIRGELTSGNVTTALGFTPYNSTNPSGYITNTGNARVTVENNGTVVGTRRAINFIPGTGISLNIADDSANEEVDVTVTNSGVTSVSGTGTVSGLTLSGTVTSTGSLTLGGAITGFLPSSGGTLTGSLTGNGGFSATGLFNQAFLQVTDSNNFWITPGNNSWGLYFETTGGGLLGGSGDSNRLGFVGNSTARFWVDLNNGNGWFGGSLSIANNTALHAGNFNSYALPLTGGTITGSSWSNTTGGDFVISNSNTVGASATLRPTNSASFSAGWSVYAGASGSAIGDGSIGFWNHTAQAARFYVTQAGAGYFAGNLALHAANYSSYAVPLSGGTMSGRLTTTAWTTSDRNYSNEWIEFPNYSGLYSPQNGAHFYPNNVTYGSWRVSGSRNSWHGLHFDSGSTLMMNSSEVGFHREGHGWQMRWSGGTGYVHKGNPGGGTQAIILDSANYTSYSPSLTGSGASGTWGISITGSANTLDGYDSTEFGSEYWRNVTVSGDANTYYPVVFENSYQDWSLYLRKQVHDYGSWDGTLTAEIEYHSSTWGGDAGYVQLRRLYQNQSNKFLASWGQSAGPNSFAIIWLRGGGRTYQWRASRLLNAPSIYYTTTDLGGSNGSVGPTTSLTTTTQITPITTYNASSELVGGNTFLHSGNYSSYALPLSGGTLSGGLLGTEVTMSGSILVGGARANNAYASVTGARLYFGGADADAQGNYYIGTNLENFGGNYNKLDLRWHTGIRMGAQASYGGIRFYDSEDLGSVIFSVGTGDANVRVANTLIANGISINQERANNARIYSNTTGGMGLLGVDSGGSFRWQLYGEGTNYGFLNGVWAGWDIRKAINGDLFVTVSSTERTVLHSGNFSSYALPLTGGTISGRITRSTSAGINSPSARFALTTGQQAEFHIASSINGSGPSNTQQYGITFSPAGGNTQAGILFSENQSDGTAIGFFCTNSYASGPQLRANIDPAGNFTAAANVTAYSDERLKKDWANLPNDFVERLANVKNGSYTRTDENMRQVGVSAQSLQQVLPEAVLEGKYLSVAYGNAALAATVELAKRVVEQQQQIAELTALVKTLLNKE